MLAESLNEATTNGFTPLNLESLTMPEIQEIPSQAIEFETSTKSERPIKRALKGKKGTKVKSPLSKPQTQSNEDEEIVSSYIIEKETD